MSKFQIGYVSSICLLVHLALCGFAEAQSTSRGSSTRTAPLQVPAPQVQIGLDGYCPVCIIDLNKWVKGSRNHAVTYDGKAYFFPAVEQKETFLSNPAKYVPALGGDCVVCLADKKQRVPGSIYHAAFSDKRLFLFPNEDIKATFLAAPGRYKNVDLAMEGNCPVHRVDLGRVVPGNPEYATYHRGMRYLFPSEKEMKVFLANPDKYVR